MDGSSVSQSLSTARRRFQHSSFAFNRRRPLFWLALAFCLGIFLDQSLSPALPTLAGCGLALLLTLIFMATQASVESADAVDAAALNKLKSKSQYRIALLAMSAAIVSGAFINAMRARIPAPNDVSRLTSAAPSFLFLDGTIVERSRASRTGGAESWTLELSQLGSDENTMIAASGRVRLSAPALVQPELSAALPDYGEGDRIHVLARVEAPPETTLPDSFDYAANLNRNGIHRIGVVFPNSVHRVGSGQWWRLDLMLRRLSSSLAEKVEAMIPGGSTHQEQAGLLNALLFGRRERLDQSDRESFAISGTAHLLAISGLQIQFIAWLLWRGFAWLRIPRRRASMLVLILSVAYCALAGADAPILRATVMIACYLSAVLLYREPDPLNVLGASALFILVLAPAELFNAGFQLSFLSVLALMTIYPSLENAWEEWRNPVAIQLGPEPGTNPFWQRRKEQFLLSTRQAFLIALSAWLATAPVVAWHMGRFSVFSLAINLVAVPLGSVCMVAGLAMLALELISTSLSFIAGWATILCLQFLEWMNAGAAALPHASIDLPPPSVAVLLVYLGLMVWIWVERGRFATMSRLALLVPSCLFILNAGTFFRPPPVAGNITVLDLKFGRCALVESSSGGAALIDSGGLGQGPRIAEMLRRRGISSLALMVVSADEPDAIDGAMDILKRVRVSRVLLPRSAVPSNTRRELENFMRERSIVYGSIDQTATLQGPGEVAWDFCDDGYGPEQVARQGTAVAVRVTLPGTRMLFVDARSDAALKRLVARTNEATGGSILQADVLRISASSGGRWPSELSQLIKQSDCRAIVAGEGSDPEENAGLDIAALAEARNLRLLSPHRDGSLRVQAEVGTGPLIQAFKNGTWQALH